MIPSAAPLRKNSTTPPWIPSETSPWILSGIPSRITLEIRPVIALTASSMILFSGTHSQISSGIVSWNSCRNTIENDIKTFWNSCYYSFSSFYKDRFRYFSKIYLKNFIQGKIMNSLKYSSENCFEIFKKLLQQFNRNIRKY